MGFPHDEINFMRNDWKLESCEEVGYDEEIQGPSNTDNYNIPHGIKPSVVNRFETFIQ